MVVGLTIQQGATWLVSAAMIGGVLARPWKLPEALWAVLGAACLVAFSLVPAADAWTAVMRGNDVYLFLAGMLLLADLAREEGLFDWAAVLAARHANGSAPRLFTLVFAIGTVVTILLSNDATAVVLTPAVCAIARRTRATPLPYVFACAFIANAASFVLPISNPANLVVFGERLPPLGPWLARFALPSVGAIGATYFALRASQAAGLRQPLEADVPPAPLSRGGRLCAVGIGATGAALLASSALGWRLGLPTLVASATTTAIVVAAERRAPLPLLRAVSWSVLPLVAGLFVMVEGLIRTGVIDTLSRTLQQHAGASVAELGIIGFLVAIGSNLLNNLPVALIAGSAIAADNLARPVVDTLLVGVDLGPNLSVTGSLATILWLIALRREGIEISAWTFLRVGVVVTIPALVVALGALAIVS